MPNAHAFTWISPGWRLPALVVVTACTIGVAIALNRQGKPLKEQVGGGIVSYELAWTRERADAILTSWRDLHAVVARQLRLDFAFLALYPLALALGCALLSQASASRFAAVGAFLSYAVLAAAPLDASENVALLRMLSAGPSDGLARLAGVCAGLKFLLVLAGLGYLALQGLSLLVSRARSS